VTRVTAPKQAAYKYCIPKPKYFRSAVTRALKKGAARQETAAPKKATGGVNAGGHLLPKKHCHIIFVTKFQLSPVFETL
jgi:hypothetical protein